MLNIHHSGRFTKKHYTIHATVSHIKIRLNCEKANTKPTSLPNEVLGIPNLRFHIEQRHKSKKFFAFMFASAQC